MDNFKDNFRHNFRDNFSANFVDNFRNNFRHKFGDNFREMLGTMSYLSMIAQPMGLKDFSVLFSSKFAAFATP